MSRTLDYPREMLLVFLLKTLTQLFKIMPHFSLHHIWNMIYLFSLSHRLFLIAFFVLFLILFAFTIPEKKFVF